MDWQTLLKSIDLETARAFVTAARRVIDALLIEGERLREAQSPAARDYNAAELSRAGPPGGWLSHEELRESVRQMAEAIAAEKWVDGVVTTVKVLTLLGGVL
jgi:hypothetical protein